MKLYILLPAYNEEKDLEKLVGSLGGYLRTLGTEYKIVVVDDGSHDRTAQIAENLIQRYPLKLIQHSVNKGYGAAIQTGFSFILSDGQDPDVLVTMDCDNTHPTECLAHLLKQIDRGCHLAIASRYQEGGGQVGFSLKRRLLSRGASWLLRFLFPINGVRDYTSGYRAYRLSALQQAMRRYNNRLIESNGFTAPMEILLKVRLLGFKIEEVPLILRYDLKNGVSKMKTMKTILAYIKVLWLYQHSKERIEKKN